MPGSLKPYHEWLGVTPNDQPLSCCRLLDVQVFEDPFSLTRPAEGSTFGASCLQLETLVSGTFQSLAGGSGFGQFKLHAMSP